MGSRTLARMSAAPNYVQTYINDVISYSPKPVLKVSNIKMNLVAGCVMEGSMVFCHKNILEHYMSFHGDYMKRSILTKGVSQI